MYHPFFLTCKKDSRRSNYQAINIFYKKIELKNIDHFPESTSRCISFFFKCQTMKDIVGNKMAI